jgi:hypothetical protein
MHKFYVRATDGAVPSVKFEFLNWHKIKIYTDETTMTNYATNKHIKMMGVPSHALENEQF